MTSAGPASPRIASLLPGATEVVAALGAEPWLVGISHECDYPPSVGDRPRLTWSPVDPSAAGGDIDRQVRALRAGGQAVIAVDGAALERARPTLLLTQDLCQVCAVVDGDLRSLVESLAPVPLVLPMRGRTVAGVLDDIRIVGRAIGREVLAETLALDLTNRLHAIAERAVGQRQRVVVVEWLEPVFLAGHWVPDLVRSAGGRDVGADPGSHSAPSSWTAIAALKPDAIVVALCGMTLDRAVGEWRRFVQDDGSGVASILAAGIPIWAIDGNAYTSRPGPRMLEAAVLFQQALRNEPGPRLVRLDAGR